MSTEITITTREQLERHIMDIIALADNPGTSESLRDMAVKRAIALTYRLAYYCRTNEQQTRKFKIN